VERVIEAHGSVGCVAADKLSPCPMSPESNRVYGAGPVVDTVLITEIFHDHVPVADGVADLSNSARDTSRMDDA